MGCLPGSIFFRQVPELAFEILCIAGICMHVPNRRFGFSELIHMMTRSFTIVANSVGSNNEVGDSGRSKDSSHDSQTEGRKTHRTKKTETLSFE